MLTLETCAVQFSIIFFRSQKKKSFSGKVSDNIFLAAVVNKKNDLWLYNHLLVSLTKSVCYGLKAIIEKDFIQMNIKILSTQCFN